jgi:hypothetical protein
VRRFGGVFTFCFFKGRILILSVLAVTLARAARDFFKENFSILAPKNAKCCSPAGALPLGWIKMGSQPSKYWKNDWGLTGSLSIAIGEIYGIIIVYTVRQILKVRPTPSEPAL